MRLGIAQIAPVFLDRAATLAKVVEGVDEAVSAGCRLVCFGEAIVPGYPVWLDRTHGARFNDPDQKRIFARCLDQAVVMERDLRPVAERAARHGITIVLGTIERALDRGGHSLYCSAVTVGGDGSILAVHRKLMPTYEERLVWAQGDGAGLIVHPVDEFALGVLNCWENWMPLARTALYAAGEDLHVALWPGCRRNTEWITRFIACESRSYVVSACGLLREQDLPADMPLRSQIAERGEMLNDGGSAIASPDGQWLIEPVCAEERLIVAEIDPARVREERQNFDPAGHYARPDVLSLTVNTARQATARRVSERAAGAGDESARGPIPFAVDTVDHVEVFVRDIDAAIGWYQRVLGLREVSRWDPHPVMIGAGGTMLALFRADPGARGVLNDAAGSPLRWRRVAWRTSRAGFEAAQSHLRACGVSFRGPVDHGRSWSVYFSDLDGHPLEITCDAP